MDIGKHMARTIVDTINLKLDGNEAKKLEKLMSKAKLSMKATYVRNLIDKEYEKEFATSNDNNNEDVKHG